LSQESMNILVATNKTYLLPLQTMLDSLCTHTDCAICVYLLHSELEQSELHSVKRVLERHNRTHKMIPIKVNKNFFDKAIAKSARVSVESYYRLIATAVLPEDLDRIMYLDADMIILDSIETLYRSDFEEKAVIACEDIGTYYKNMNYFMGVKNGRYFNAGVMVWNMPMVRKIMPVDVVEKMVSESYKYPMQDQGIFNVPFDGKTKFVSAFQYNFMPCCADKYRSREQSEIHICHFAGGRACKPWEEEFQYQKYGWIYWRHAWKYEGLKKMFKCYLAWRFSFQYEW